MPSMGKRRSWFMGLAESYEGLEFLRLKTNSMGSHGPKLSRHSSIRDTQIYPSIPFAQSILNNIPSQPGRKIELTHIQHVR
jgi:hypothetical protein